MNIGDILAAVAVVGGVGLLFGIVLAVAAHIFAVQKDERAEKILEVLPGANCGSCGYAGCSAYADAVAKGEAEVNACTVGKGAVASQIADIMGTEAGEVEECIARVMCGGDCASALYKFEYDGIEDCVAAAKFAGGAKKCQSGCLGLGHCANICPFNAIKIEDGVAVVDENLCQACGKCVKSCPKSLIKLVPKNSKLWVLCSNPETGKFVNQYCKKGCIGCKLCEKACAFDAIHVVDNHAIIDYDKCKNCGACARKCPRGVIHTPFKPAKEEA
jgi:electron transport complex protein RnfB